MLCLGCAVLGKVRGYKSINFLVEGQLIEGKELGIEAYGEWLESGGKEFKKVYFLPESLREYVEDVPVFFPNSEPVLMPSLTPVDGYSTDATYEFVEFYIFIELLHRYLKDSPKELFCDISLGLNIYAHAIFEAFRRLFVFARLMNFSQQEKERFYALFTEPILANEDNTPKKVFTKPVEVKAFFDIPIKREDFKKLEEEQILSRRELERFKDAYYMFQSIKLNTPLVVLTFGYPTKDEIKSMVEKVVGQHLESLKGKVYNPNFDNIEKRRTYEPYKVEYIKLVYNLLLSLALCYDVSRQLEKYGINPKGQEKSRLEEVEKFLEIYEVYNLRANGIILGKDIEGVKKGMLKEDIFRKKNPNRVDKRNFWAHSGFEYNITEYKNGYIYYTKLDIVKNLLLDI